MNTWLVTANRLDDGGVAYLTSARTWSSDIGEAALFENAARADADRGWAKGQEHLVCDPYVIAVTLDSGGPTPLSARERIRAEGPEPTLRRLGYVSGLARRAAAG